MLHANKVIIGISGAQVAACQNVEIQEQTDTIEVASPTSGKAKDFITGRSSWGFTTSYLVVETDTPLKNIKAMSGKTVTITAETSQDDRLQGTAICTSVTVSLNQGALVKGSFSFQGTGALQ